MAANATATTTGPRYRNTTTAFNVTTTAVQTTSVTDAPTVNITSLTSGFTRIATQSSAPTLTIPGMTLMPVTARNLTRAYQAVATTLPSCYHLPTASDDLNHGVMLHNEELRGRNASLPSAYVEAFYSDADGVQPLLLALRKNSTRHFLDISKPNQIGLVDSIGNSLHLDQDGIHFATNTCEFAYSVTAEGLYQQLRQLSGIACAAGIQFKTKQPQTISQVLFMQDQCGRSVDSSIRPYSQLQLGGLPCNVVDVDGDAGKWTFSCVVSNATSAVAKCETGVRTALDYILDDPFGGACPSLPDVVTTLSTYGDDLLNGTVMNEAFLSVSSSSSRINQTVAAYQQLWSGLRAVFSSTATLPSVLQQYITVYNKYRDFSKDICTDLHPVLNTNITMSLKAGASYEPALLTFTTLPSALQPLNVTITDPSNIACCSAGYESSMGGANNKTCAYAAEAFNAFPGCVCGKTTEESALAYKVRQCQDYDVTCLSSVDCQRPGGDDRVCVKGSCCGRGICIDPFECSEGSF